jgi:monoamine oxidase
VHTAPEHSVQNDMSPGSTPRQTREADVLVVGAGLAGLTAARALVAAGASTAVVEARDRVGGRTFSRASGTGVFDLGAQYVGHGQARLANLARELGLQIAPTPHAGTKWIELSGHRASYTGNIPKLPPLALLQLQLVISSLDRLSRQFHSATPWTAPRAAALDAHTVESWWCRFALGRHAGALMRHTIRMTFGAEADEMSMLSLMQYLSGAGGLAHMTAIENGGQQGYVIEEWFGYMEGAIESGERAAREVLSRSWKARQHSTACRCETHLRSGSRGQVDVAVNLAERQTEA